MASSEVEDEVGTSGRGEEGVESMASDAGEEMSPDPDSLKNTPSNIARLEDVIEQCSGRQKYLARTKSPSDGEDVRWYFCRFPLLKMVSNQLNRLYLKFIKRNPGYDGKVKTKELRKPPPE